MRSASVCLYAQQCRFDHKNVKHDKNKKTTTLYPESVAVFGGFTHRLNLKDRRKSENQVACILLGSNNASQEVTFATARLAPSLSDT